MTSADFFFISAGVGIWVAIITTTFLVYKIIKLVTETELEVKSIKNNLKLSGLTLISKLLGTSKGGENNDSK